MVSDQHDYRSACVNALQLASANYITCSCTTHYWLKISQAFLVWRSRHKVEPFDGKDWSPKADTCQSVGQVSILEDCQLNVPSCLN